MRKIRLPQPYAQMVVCGALRSIPNRFKGLRSLEKIYIYADDFAPDFQNGIDIDNELHRRVCNEMVLGNIPDDTYHYNCFIGYVIISSEEESYDNWYAEYIEHLQVKNAKEFRTYVENYDTEFSFLESTKVKGTELRRIKRDGNRLTVPLGKAAWEKLKYKETAEELYLFWEPYMSRITPFWLSLFTKELDVDDDIDEVVFKYHNQTKMFDSFGVCSGSITFEIGVDKYGKPKHKSFYVLKFCLEHLIKGDRIEELPSMTGPIEDINNDVNEIEDEPVRKFRNPWPRFISVPMGGQNKWRRR